MHVAAINKSSGANDRMAVLLYRLLPQTTAISLKLWCFINYITYLNIFFTASYDSRHFINTSGSAS